MMKIHQIIAVLAMVFGLGGAFVAYSFSGLSAELITNGSISLVSSILGLLGIYLFEKDYKIAIVQYIICGIGVLVGTSLFGILGFIFYLMAAVIAYMERDKGGYISSNGLEDAHFFGEESEIRRRYSNFPKNTNNSTVYWIIPTVSVIIIILVGVLGGLSYANDMQAKSDGIELTNLSSDIKVEYGYYTGGVQGILKSQRDLDNVQIKGLWYSESGAQIDETYDSSLISDIKANHEYNINIPYYKPSNDKPKHVEIQVYESFDDKPIYSKNITFN